MKQLVGIQGGKGSFHEQAAVQYFGESTKLAYIATFHELFQKLQTGSITKAVVAISNNRYNFIPAPFATLTSDACKDYWITGETYVHVQHQLLGTMDASLATIAEVHSQAPALGQCMDFLQVNFPHIPLVEQDDTSLSAKLVAQWQDPKKAAIASCKAGTLHGLKVLAKNIQDDKHNYTRFLVLERRSSAKVIKGNKTTLLLQTAQHPGSLANVLNLFKDQAINIDTIHSSYLPNSKFTMQFFMEFNAGLQQKHVKIILQRLVSEQNCRITVLGTYKSAALLIDDTEQQNGELYI